MYRLPINDHESNRNLVSKIEWVWCDYLMTHMIDHKEVKNSGPIIDKDSVNIKSLDDDEIAKSRCVVVKNRNDRDIPYIISRGGLVVCKEDPTYKRDLEYSEVSLVYKIGNDEYRVCYVNMMRVSESKRSGFPML